MLSSSYRNRLARAMPEEEEAPPPPPPPDFIVTGTLNPDSTGNYFEAGTHYGKPYYAREDDAWFISYWTLGPFFPHTWFIGTTLCPPPGAHWWKGTNNYEPPPGTYATAAGSTGTATVAEP